MPQTLRPPVSRSPGARVAHRATRRNVLTTVAGALVATAVLAFLLADRREEFAAALGAAPVWILLAATALQLLALVSRTEAWHVCVGAAGGTVARRRLYRAASVGYLGSQFNSQMGTAARIGALRRTAPDECPRVPALIAAEVAILAVEGALAALASFTLVGPLGLPWWLPLVFLGVAVLLMVGLGRVAGRWREGFWSGLAVVRSLRGRSPVDAPTRHRASLRSVSTACPRLARATAGDRSHAMKSTQAAG